MDEPSPVKILLGGGVGGRVSNSGCFFIVIYCCIKTVITNLGLPGCNIKMKISPRFKAEGLERVFTDAAPPIATTKYMLLIKQCGRIAYN